MKLVGNESIETFTYAMLSKKTVTAGQDVAPARIASATTVLGRVNAHEGKWRLVSSATPRRGFTQRIVSKRPTFLVSKMAKGFAGFGRALTAMPN